MLGSSFGGPFFGGICDGGCGERVVLGRSLEAVKTWVAIGFQPFVCQVLESLNLWFQLRVHLYVSLFPNA